jgi:hypothetical protein
MSRRIDPVDQVVQFFETAPLETAQTVLTIARGILARRTPKAKPAKPGPLTADEKNGRRVRSTREASPLLDGAEVVAPHVKTTRGGLAVPEDDRS